MSLSGHSKRGTLAAIQSAVFSFGTAWPKCVWSWRLNDATSRRMDSGVRIAGTGVAPDAAGPIDAAAAQTATVNGRSSLFKRTSQVLTPEFTAANTPGRRRRSTV
jgi:hypothetical protein